MGEHNQPGESYEDAARRGLREELSVSWDDSVKGWFGLELSLLDITYLTPGGKVHRRDLQWTQSFVVELAEGAKVALDDENRDFALVPLDSVGRWLESHDTCSLANVERRASRPGFDLASHASFERGTLGELKADSLRRVREALAGRRRRRGQGGRSDEDL